MTELFIDQAYIDKLGVEHLPPTPSGIRFAWKHLTHEGLKRVFTHFGGNPITAMGDLTNACLLCHKTIKADQTYYRIKPTVQGHTACAGSAPKKNNYHHTDAYAKPQEQERKEEEVAVPSDNTQLGQYIGRLEGIEEGLKEQIKILEDDKASLRKMNERLMAVLECSLSRS